jgi:hypothetical protein
VRRAAISALDVGLAIAAALVGLAAVASMFLLLNMGKQ